MVGALYPPFLCCTALAFKFSLPHFFARRRLGGRGASISRIAAVGTESCLWICFCRAREFEVFDAFLSQYRLHETSITNSGSLSELAKDWHLQRFERLMGRKWNRVDPIIALLFRAIKHVRNPTALIERFARVLSIGEGLSEKRTNFIEEIPKGSFR